MKLSEELNQIKKENQPKDMKVTYTRCSKCKQATQFGVCLECGLCGRLFSNGKLVVDVE